MDTSITPTNYGLVPYGKVSYVAYFSNQGLPIVIAQPLVIETLTNQFLPAFVKAYYSVKE